MDENLVRLERIVKQIETLEAERIRQESTGHKPIVKMRPEDCRDVIGIFEILKAHQDYIAKRIGFGFAYGLEGRADTDLIYRINYKNNKNYGDLLREASATIREICAQMN